MKTVMKDKKEFFLQKSWLKTTKALGYNIDSYETVTFAYKDGEKVGAFWENENCGYLYTVIESISDVQWALNIIDSFEYSSYGGIRRYPEEDEYSKALLIIKQELTK